MTDTKSWIESNCPYPDDSCPCDICDPDKKSTCWTCHYADADSTCRDTVYGGGGATTTELTFRQWLHEDTINLWIFGVCILGFIFTCLNIVFVATGGHFV